MHFSHTHTHTHSLALILSCYYGLLTVIDLPMLVGGTDKKFLEHCNIHYTLTTENTGYMMAAVPQIAGGPQ